MQQFGIPPIKEVDTAQLAANLLDSRRRSLELLLDLSDAQLLGPKLPTVNPLSWEFGHVAWFHDHFALERCYAAAPTDPHAHKLYDSIAVHHHQRWDLPLPPRERIFQYAEQVQQRQLDRLTEGLAPFLVSYVYQLTTLHEDMHGEAFTWARQTHAYPRPQYAAAADARGSRVVTAGQITGDRAIPGGAFLLGAPGDTPFVLDNEKWAHPVTIAPFKLAAAPVTNSEFLEFVRAGGYLDERLWSDTGWDWRVKADARHPIYWQPDGEQGFSVRHFDAERELEPRGPIIHVNWFEADAYCRWAGRRLPSEAEWEAAALGEPSRAGDTLRESKRRYPWGHHGDPSRANLDGKHLGPVSVDAYGEGDSAFGVRQMLGNVWEWCQDWFTPYPGFTPDLYKEYSQPLFGTTKVLRGGAWPSRSRLASGLYRNYFGPERRDVFAGFRTCAIE